MAERVPNGQPRLLSVSEVSQRTGLAVSTVRHKIADGTLPALKLGPNRHSAVRVDEAELERWIYGWDEPAAWAPSRSSCSTRRKHCS